MHPLASWTAYVHHFSSALQASKGFVSLISNSVWKKLGRPNESENLLALKLYQR